MFHLMCRFFPTPPLQGKEEVMAVRLREADNMAAMAELQQQISELEIQVMQFGVQPDLRSETK